LFPADLVLHTKQMYGKHPFSCNHLMHDLTPPQLAVFRFLEHRYAAGLTVPTVREICKEMGYSSTKSGQDVLEALERKGWISRDGGKARSIHLLRSSASGIPLLGNVAAGLPSDAGTSALEHLDLNPEAFGIPSHHRAFALRVRGDSMTGRRLFDGDLVICDADAEPQAGRVVVALIDQESTLKTLVRERGKIWLKAENPAYPEIHPAATLTIQGVACAVIHSIAA
jgi:repressor LexA